MKKTSTPRKMPARPIPALLFLAQPNTMLIVVKKEAHIIWGKKQKHIPSQNLDAMIELGWVEGPKLLDDEVLLYRITQKGRDTALKIEEDKRGYFQLDLPLEELQRREELATR